MSATELDRTGRGDPAGPGPRDGRRGGRWRLPVALLCTAAAVVGVRALVVEPQRIGSASMSPTVCTGDLVLVRHLLLGAPEDGDIVTFRNPEDGTDTIKRVVATAGQEVRLVDGQLRVAGRDVSEPYVNQATIDGVYFGPVTVPAGSVFVLGDDREISVDSRNFGALPVEAIDGRLSARLTHGDCAVR